MYRIEIGKDFREKKTKGMINPLVRSALTLSLLLSFRLYHLQGKTIEVRRIKADLSSMQETNRGMWRVQEGL
jgi:hypothetical protein